MKKNALVLKEAVSDREQEIDFYEAIEMLNCEIWSHLLTPLIRGGDNLSPRVLPLQRETRETNQLPLNARLPGPYRFILSFKPVYPGAFTGTYSL